MRPLISLLPIPFFVLGQSLPHSHAGTGVEHSSDHGGRPHVHFSGSHSHDNRHVEASHHHDREAEHSESVGVAGIGVSCPPLDHDADAIYLPTSTSFASRVVVSDQIDWVSDDARIYCWLELEVQPKPGGRITPPQRNDGIPIYLLVASLRI
jgi:hypothetical protein